MTLVYGAIGMSGLAVGCLFAWQYGSSAQDIYSAAYIVLSLAAGAAFLGLAFWRDARRHVVAAVLCSPVIAAYLFEAYVQTFRPREHSSVEGSAGLAATERDRDRRSRWDVLAELEAGTSPGIVPRYVPFVPPPLRIDGREIVVMSGVANRATLSGNENGYWVTYKSDRFGFRNPDQVWDAPRADIVLLGDSFTFGAEVRDDEHYAYVLRQRHPATINLGYPSSGPLGYLAALTEYGAAKKPKLVLIFFYEGNDAADMVRDFASPVLRKYLTPGFRQDLDRQQGEIELAMLRVISEAKRQFRISPPALERRGFELQRWFKLQELQLRLELPSFYAADRFDRFVDVELMSTIFERIRELAESWQGRAVIVYLPAWRNGRDTERTTRRLERVRAGMIAAAQKADLPVIDTLPAFHRHATPNRLNAGAPNPGGHYSPEGYKLVGEVVLHQLETMNYVSR
ncbi:MAG: SGNH/GDSL hydrolase family protein [Alphaproteobacteria bacterium]|nr:SGNH/GDSL hydrolase family protein [Alphaproteobacteria bacterium]